MIVGVLQTVPLGVIIPTIIVLLFIAVLWKKNKTKESLKTKDRRIFSYKPEPLIDYSRIDNNALNVIKQEENAKGYLNLAKVNYLNLLNNVGLRREAESCIRIYGVGSCGPRGFYGTIDVHLTLEKRLSEFMGMEETVLYSYGFSTISSAIGAYCKRTDIIFCDQKISFPAMQGMLAARSMIVYFKHNDMDNLETRLKEYDRKDKQRKKPYRKFLLVEGIYGTTGTICPLPKLMELREKYKLRIFIDESLSFGVLGKTGRGVTEHFNINRNDVDMIIGSLEGSMSSVGGFCVGASFIVDHQRLSGLGYCFSASLPPFLSHISICALDMFEKDSTLFEQLKSVSIKVHKKLKKLNGYVVISDPLSPLKVITTKDLENRLDYVKNIYTNCVNNNIQLLYAEDSLRFNVNVGMDEGDVDKLITVLNNSI